ncbi:MAG: RNA polymerase sigma factor [Planctomycetota bacterium]
MDSALERKLVLSCRTGDRSAYTDLVKAYSNRVFAICVGMLGNRHDAEDIAQQVFLNGFKDINQLLDGERFGAWIGRITKNLCIDFIRRQRYKRNNRPGQYSAIETGRAAYPELEGALARLVEEYRLVLMLYYFDGHSAKNIAEALDITEAAVHTRMSRARKELRKLLESEGVT